MWQRMKYLADDDLVTPVGQWIWPGRRPGFAPWRSRHGARLSGRRPRDPRRRPYHSGCPRPAVAGEPILTTGRPVNGRQNCAGHTGEGRQRWPRGACLVRQAQIDTIACEFTANDTSLRFLGEAARAGRRQPGTALAHSCAPARNTPMGQPHPQAMPGPALRATFRRSSPDRCPRNRAKLILGPKRLVIRFGTLPPAGRHGPEIALRGNSARLSQCPGGYSESA